MPTNVLFVCLGNICRSPTACGVLEKKIAQAGLTDQIGVDSAGTSDWHIGRPPDPRTLAAAAKAGYDLSSQRARQVSRDDFDRFDYILAMDRKNLAELEALKPKRFTGHLGLFLDGWADSPCRDMPDPYYGSAEDFAQVVRLSEAAAQAWLEALIRRA
jgi:protein-tyrosine phosphatase